MELSSKAEVELARALKTSFSHRLSATDVVLCPSHPSLAQVAEMIGQHLTLQVGTQNIHWEEKGPWTGQVSVLQVSHFAQWVILGHSEQRALTQETENEIQRKVDLALKHSLTPIMCVGETADERNQEMGLAKITRQVQGLLQKSIRTAMGKIVIAYEPIWAIGTGKTPDPSEVAAAMLLIRKVVAERFDQTSAEKIRVIYGGSVTADNVTALMAEPGIDGVLVGGASIHPSQFRQIVEAIEAVGLKRA